LARTANRNPCRYDSYVAAHWDITGALLKTSRDEYLIAEITKKMERVMRQTHPRMLTLTDLNDAKTTTWKDIRGLVNTTIEQLDSGPALGPRKAAHRNARRSRSSNDA